MTELAVIPPIPHLPEVHQQYNLALMHLMSNPDYLSWYRWCSDFGRFVILDNSQHEGYTFDIRDIVETADQVGAKEIVIPDVYPSREETVEKANISFTLMLMHSKTRAIIEGLRPSFMLVPQGTNIHEVLTCITDLCLLFARAKEKYPRVFTKMTIGFPVQSTGVIFTQEDLPYVSRMIASKCLQYGYQSHILGWDKSPWEIVIPLVERYAFRSVDTSKPFSFAGYDGNVPLSERTRQKDYFTRVFSKEELGRAHVNIKEFRQKLREAVAVRETAGIR